MSRVRVPEGVPSEYTLTGVDVGNTKANLISGNSAEADYEVGVDNGEGPPVPIPNTEVKLTRADNTWLATARENR